MDPANQALPGKRRFWRLLSTLRQDNGNILIESALVAPIVLTMTFGFINFSLVMFGMGNANFAGRAALRYATLHSNTSYKPTTQQDLNNIVAPYIFRYPNNTWSVTSSYYAGNNVGAGGVYITVSITYSFSIMGKTYTGLSYSTTGCGSIQQ